MLFSVVPEQILSLSLSQIFVSLSFYRSPVWFISNKKGVTVQINTVVLLPTQHIINVRVYRIVIMSI